MAFQYQVDETLSLFPFICGLCFEKFDNIAVYYNHLNGSHQEAQRYFHGSHCSRGEVTGPESGDSAASETRLFYCGKCSYVSPSLCQLHEHLVEREHALRYQMVIDSRTAFPCSVKEELIDDQDCFTETVAAQESRSGATQESKEEQYQNQETDLGNVKPNLFTNAEAMSRTTVDIEKDTVKKKSDKLSKKPKSSQPSKFNKNKNDAMDDEIPESVTTVRHEIIVEGDTKNNKNQLDSLDSEDQKITTKYTHDNHPEHMEEPVESITCKSEDSSTDSGSVEKEDDCKPVQDCNTYIPCNLCAVNIRQKRMKYHMIIHTDERNFPCELCKDRFKNQQKLQNHMNTVHAEKETAICQICGKVFKHHSYLKQHVETHSERDKKCPECPATFSTIKMLRRHMIYHSDEKPHECSLCDKEFSHKGGLRNHMQRVHTENRPHACPTCGKCFKQRRDLPKHMLSHGPPRYGCPVCFKMFVTPNARKVHVKQHIQRGEFE